MLYNHAQTEDPKEDEMGALLKLLNRRPSQALIKAPDANLIRSDNELMPPEPKDIETELEPDKLALHAKASHDFGFAKKAVDRERSLHILKNKNFKVYDKSRVYDFMTKYIKHIQYIQKPGLGNDLWWQWIGLDDYRHPLPSRVVDSIKTIYSYDATEYSRNNFAFFVSDIILATSRNGWNECRNTGEHLYTWKVIPMKRKTEICFLWVAVSKDALPEEGLIIDAWRGPTFSDEEAKI